MVSPSRHDGGRDPGGPRARRARGCRRIRRRKASGANYARPTREQRIAFAVSAQHMVADLKAGQGFRKSLGIKGVRGHPGIYEMRWADDGRATFSYGTSPNPGDAHIIWRRIGGHDILLNP